MNSVDFKHTDPSILPSLKSAETILDIDFQSITMQTHNSLIAEMTSVPCAATPILMC